MRTPTPPLAALLMLFAAGGLPAFAEGPGRGACVRLDERLFIRSAPDCAAAPEVGQSGTLPKTNSLGYWAPEPSSDGAPRVLVLGDFNFLVPEDGDATSTAIFASRFRAAQKGSRLEVVNAGTKGHSLVQAYLELPSLLEKVRPQAVVLLVSLSTELPATFFYDRIAASRGENGLASSIGPASYFWPAPRFLEPWIWKRKWARGFARYSMLAREYFLLLKMRLFGGANLPETLGNYVLGMREQCARANCELIVVNTSAPPSNGRVEVRFLGSVFKTGLFTKFAGDSFEPIFSRMKAAGIKVVSLQESFAWVYYLDQTYWLGAASVAPNAEGMRFLGESLAEALAREPSLATPTAAKNKRTAKERKP